MYANRLIYYNYLWDDCEINPQKKPFGHLVKVPCGFHRKVGRYSCFIDADGREVDDVIAHLNGIQPWSLPDDLPPPTGKLIKAYKAHPTIRDRVKSNVTSAHPETPGLMPKVKTLFEKCQFLREFREHPERVNYHHWKHAGMILTALGDEGEKWFTFISCLDAARFDGSHLAVIDSIRNRDYKPPTCTTIRCALCDQESPLQWLAPSSKFHAFVAEDQPQGTPCISMEDLRMKLKQQIKERIDGHKSQNTNQHS